MSSTDRYPFLFKVVFWHSSDSEDKVMADGFESQAEARAEFNRYVNRWQSEHPGQVKLFPGRPYAKVEGAGYRMTIEVQAYATGERPPAVAGRIGRSGTKVHAFTQQLDHAAGGWVVSRYPVCGSGSGGYRGLFNSAHSVSQLATPERVTCKKCLQWIKEVASE